jgi:hypothetical protein
LRRSAYWRFTNAVQDENGDDDDGASRISSPRP